MQIPLTLSDIFMAILWGTIIFIIIKVLSNLFRSFIARTTIYPLRPEQLTQEQLDALLRRCQYMFPIEMVVWAGNTYHRGNSLRVVTVNNATIEGEFIGVNNEKMICLVTPQSVVAQEINSISDITKL